jgi:pseudaminic acid cytidylyltransferase
MRIAVIPARGGSKRIPRKNVKVFNDRPMIAYSIEAALNSACFDEVIVSTDDTEIAKISNDLGASTPFIRPNSLSDDYTGTVPVIKHAIEWYSANKKKT